MFYDEVAKWASGLLPFAVVTITRATGSTPREPGAKMIVDSSGLVTGTIGGGNLEQLAIRDAQQCISDGKTRVFNYPLCAKTGQCCGGAVDTFVDVINTGPVLYIFGAGHVGQALARTMSETPFKVQIIDERQEWAGPAVSESALPPSIKRHLAEPLAIIEDLIWDKQRTYAVVMTHSHDLDFSLVSKISQLPAKSIGLIGSQTKWDSFKNRFRQENTDPDQIQRIRCPVGVDIGGKSPQEVAISIAAELIALHHHGRTPGAR